MSIIAKLVNRSCDIVDRRKDLIKLILENDLSQHAIEKAIINSNLYAMHTVGNVPLPNFTRASRTSLGSDETVFSPALISITKSTIL